MEYDKFKKIFTRINIEEDEFNIVRDMSINLLSRALRVLGENGDYALGLMIAHKWTVINSYSDVVGAKSSESNNGMQVSSNGASSKSEFASTKYGNELIGILKSIGMIRC